MAEESIDRISIEISSDATAAVRTLNNLVTALGKLETKVGSSATKLLQYSSAVNQLRRSVAGLDVTNLRQLGDVKFSATVPKNLATLVNTLKSMPADSAWKLMGITSALGGLRNVALPKGAVDQLAKVPHILREFQSLNMGEFTTQVRMLNAQLAPLAANIDKLAVAYGKLPKSLQTAGLAARSVTSANKYLNTANSSLVASNNMVIASNSKLQISLTSLSSAVSVFTNKVFALTAAWQVFKRLFQSTIGNVNTYIENMNLSRRRWASTPRALQNTARRFKTFWESTSQIGRVTKACSRRSSLVWATRQTVRLS